MRATLTRQRRRTAPAAPALPEQPAPKVLGLHPRDAWHAMSRQPASFWLLVIYVMFEYVRPQTIWTGIAFLPWAFLSIMACAAVFVLEGARFRKATAADPWMAAFTGILAISIVMAYSPEASLEAIDIYINWLLAYILITNIAVTYERLILLIMSYFVWSLKMSQYAVRSWSEAGFGFRSWGITGPSGWFHNSGEFAIQMVIFFAMSLYVWLALRPHLKRWVWLAFSFLPFSAMIGVVGASSRGAQLALAAIGIWIWVRSKHKIRSLVGVGVLAAVAWQLLPAEQKERFTEMGDDETSTNRIQYWEDGLQIMGDHPVFGIGYDNWLTFYRTYYNALGEVSHNIFIQAGSELGYPGLIAFVGLIFATFLLNYRTRKIAAGLGTRGGFLHGLARGMDGALLGYLVAGFFVTVLYYPFFWFNLAFTVAAYNVARVEQKAARRAVRIAALTAPPAHAP
jgi:putative inorganic carbon (hco3(-)) transporter